MVETSLEAKNLLVGQSLGDLFLSNVKKKNPFHRLETKEAVQSFCDYFTELQKYDDGTYTCCGGKYGRILFYVENYSLGYLKITLCWNCYRGYENYLHQNKQHKLILGAMQYLVHRIGREDLESTFKTMFNESYKD